MNFIIAEQLKTIGEQWKANHIEAMGCYHFEDLLLYCIEAFERINREDEAWRGEVLNTPERYNAETEHLIDSLYRQWLGLCENFLKPLKELQGKFDVAHADRFLGCIREAKGMQTEDSEFFSGDALVDLCDDAIDEHKKGETLDGSW